MSILTKTLVAALFISAALSASPVFALASKSAGVPKTSVLSACTQNGINGGPCRIASDGHGNLSGCSQHSCFICPPKGTKCYGTTF